MNYMDTRDPLSPAQAREFIAYAREKNRKIAYKLGLIRAEVEIESLGLDTLLRALDYLFSQQQETLQ